MTSFLTEKTKSIISKTVYVILFIAFAVRVAEVFVSNAVIFDNSGKTLDASWIYALNHLNEMGSVSGKNLFFTYGPLGYLLYPLGWNIVPSVFFAGVLLAFDFYALIKMFNKQESLVRNSFLIGALCFFMNTEAAFVVFSLLLMCVTAFRFKKGAFSFGLLCLMTALLTLIKYDLAVVSSLFIAAFWVMAFMDRSFVERNKRTPFVVITILTPALCAAAYLIYNPSFADLVRYYKTMIILSAGYSSAMALPFPSFKMIVIIAALLIAGVICVAVPLFFRRFFYSGILCLIPLLYSYKSVSVRADMEHFQVSLSIAGMALVFLCFMYLMDMNHLSFWGKALQLTVFSFVSCLVSYIYLKTNRELEFKIISYEIIALCISVFLFLVLKETGVLKKAKIAEPVACYSLALFAVCISTMIVNSYTDSFFSNGVFVYTRLPEQIRSYIGDNTVTAYPWDILWGAGEDLNYVNYPSLQSYVAYDEYIDDLNAEFFSGPDAPEYIICEVNSIDYRLYTWESPDTYEAIMENYEYSGLQQMYPGRQIFLLSHTGHNENRQMVESTTYEADIHDPINIPLSDNIRTINLEFRETPVVTFYKLFYRVKPLYVDVCFDDGYCESFVFIPGLYGREIPLDSILPDGTYLHITSLVFWGPTSDIYDQNVTYTVTEYETAND